MNAADPVSRRGTTPTHGFFDGRPPALICALGVVFILAVGLLEYVTDARLTLALFSLMPVVLVTWNLGSKAGATFALLATAAVVAADTLGRRDLGPEPYWNGIAQLLVLMFVVWILAALRRVLDLQASRLSDERHAADELRHLNAVKDTLLHAVSHDLKGPLAAVLGAMQTLRREAQLGLTAEELESLYAMIEQSGQKMDRLVDDLLNMGRLERGQLHPH
ncbi:MAG: histidine kinase dimerization/phospho-acceptor domain-containing protein, partial [Actinomycetota bacterium]